MVKQILHIKIIDTNENELELISEHTQMQSPSLNYSGGDDKFTHIMASQLNFNMLVTDGSDGKFLHLFTGNETRYKVVLEDITNENSPIDLWNGFLFPETYSETFGGSTFFVNFSASDGLGRLKNKYLPTDYYTQQQPITQIIAECLKLTGNELPLLIAPAIVNATVDFTLNNLKIDGSIYNDDEDYTAAYTILEDCLKTLGATLFQQKGNWYIIGFNRNNTLFLAAESYTANGIYIENKTIYRKSLIGKFEESATISIIPPFKTVTVNWAPNNEDSILPENIVSKDLTTHTVGGWGVSTNWIQTMSVTDSFYAYRYSKNFSMDSNFLVNPFNFIPGTYYVSLIGTDLLTAANQFDNYISLKNKIYIDTDYLEPLLVNLTISVRLKMSKTVSDDDVNDLANRVLYKVFLGDEEIITNDPVNGVIAEYDFTFSKESETVISGEVELNNVSISEDGKLDIRLYPALNTTEFDNEISIILFESLEIEVSDGIVEDYELNRDIDFTTTQDVELAIGATATSFITNTIEIDESVPFTSALVDVPATDYNIEVLGVTPNHSVVNDPFFSFDFWSAKVEISEVDYHYLQQKSDYLFIKKAGTETFIASSTPFFYSDEDTGELGVELFAMDEASLFTINDELYIIQAAETITVTEREILDQTWKQYGGKENTTYINTLMRVYHSAQPTALKTVNGSLFGLVWPLDMVEFNYINPFCYQVTNATLDLTDGQTEVTLIENTIDVNITDYE